MSPLSDQKTYLIKNILWKNLKIKGKGRKSAKLITYRQNTVKFDKKKTLRKDHKL